MDTFNSSERSMLRLMAGLSDLLSNIDEVLICLRDYVSESEVDNSTAVKWDEFNHSMNIAMNDLLEYIKAVEDLRAKMKKGS